MNKALLLLIITTSLTIDSFAQQIIGDDWIETEATITEIFVHRRSKSATLTVDYIKEDGSKSIGQVSALCFPFIGTLKSEGDKITIWYDPDTGQTLRQGTSLVEKYGLYLMIGLGVFFSASRLRSIYRGYAGKAT